MEHLIQQIEGALGLELFDHQREVIEGVSQRVADGHSKSLVFYPTGKGKTITSLGALFALGHTQALVIAPPATQPAWEAVAGSLGIEVQVMSHAKFRQKGTLVSREIPIIADEFHLFGGVKGVGWRKFTRVAQGMEAPVILMSATPNYNDAERVYCIHHVLNPGAVRGGFETFIYAHCTLEPSFRGLPNVTGFKDYDSAAEYLAALPDVYFLPDEVEYEIIDVPLTDSVPPEWKEYNFDPRTGLVMHSMMTRRISAERYALLDDAGRLRPEPLVEVVKRCMALPKGKKLLVFCAHKTVAVAASLSISSLTHLETILVTGDTSYPDKKQLIAEFIESDRSKILIGTATLATGTDGLDKVCDTLIILQDTTDDSLRRQLVGRILPRGASDDVSNKKIYRMSYWLP